MASMTSLLSVPRAGAQFPRISTVPEFASSAGAEAVELAARAGLHLDKWEQGVLHAGCGERADGKWAAFEVGLVVPRQNGKGAVEEARELAGLFLFGERLIIHSAHEQATSSEHFRRLLNLIEGVPEFEQRVLKVVKGKGSEAIELKGGQRILFKTRTGGGGRGLTADLVVLDEAMILPEATTAALVPTMAARAIHGNPQLWYAGSAVDQQKHEHGVVLSRLRARALDGAPRVAYFEWSVEGDNPEAVPDDVRRSPGAWAQANPGLGIRISEEHIANECNGALGPREFAVERLGVGDWASGDQDGDGIELAAWDACRDEDSKPLEPFCLAFDVRPDRSAATIAVAGYREDGVPHVGVADYRPGTDWVVGRLVELTAQHATVAVICDRIGPAGALLAELQHHVMVTSVGAQEQARGCGVLFDAIAQGSVRHRGHEELRTAVKGARKRPLVDSWAWSRKTSAVDISPLVAVTLALWGLVDGAPGAGGFEW